MRAGGTMLTADEARALYRAERQARASAEVLAAARAEYEAWLAQPRTVYVPLLTGGERRVWFKVCLGRERPAPRRRTGACSTPDCERPLFAAGRCRPCYFRAYNASRVRNRTPKRRTAAQLAARGACACGAPVPVQGPSRRQCPPCYWRDYNARRPGRRRGQAVA